MIDVATRTKPNKLCENREAVAFVKKYKDEAFAIAARYGVAGKYLLGLSARESGYGKGTFVQNNGNAFFNLQKELPDGLTPTAPDIARMPYATGMVPAKEVNSKTGKRAWVYTYGSFTDAAKSLMDVYGGNVRGAATTRDFLNGLKQAGFNPYTGFTDPTVLDQAAERLKCPG